MFTLRVNHRCAGYMMAALSVSHLSGAGLLVGTTCVSPVEVFLQVQPVGSWNLGNLYDLHFSELRDALLLPYRTQVFPFLTEVPLTASYPP